MLNISVLISGGGTNLQAVMDGLQKGEIQGAKIVQVISSNEKAFGLERAKNHGIKGLVIGKSQYSDIQERTNALIAALKKADTDLIVLAGYMSVLQPALIQAYKGRVINIHPSLIPAYCGKGFYGKKVHQAVLDAGEKKTGATVHFVDEGVDTGNIILQEEVLVEPGDTADLLAARVLEVEHKILKQAVKQLVALLQKEGE